MQERGRPMTEAEWLAATDLIPMLESLEGKTSERKLRLAGCALCRHLWEVLPDLGSSLAIDVVGRYADGSATQKELTSARKRAIRISGVAAENEDHDIYLVTVIVKCLCARDGQKEGGSRWVSAGLYMPLQLPRESKAESGSCPTLHLRQPLPPHHSRPLLAHIHRPCSPRKPLTECQSLLMPFKTLVALTKTC
jgi:hypothetical protein